MPTFQHARWPALLALLCFLAACGGNESSGNSKITISSAVQDLTVAPSGQVTVLTFSGAPGAVVPANFESDGAATATGVFTSGKTVTVSWNERVSPSDRVRATGLEGVGAGWSPVSTTDPSAPTFTVASANQVAGLGGDTISIQFAGPHVIEDEAEDLGNWQLRVNNTALDLSGSVLSLNPGTQVLTVTTGPGANLHASFDLAALNLHSVAETALSTSPVTGAATGDTTPPGLVSALQNLSEDEFGRVVDFTFSKAMDPVFAAVATSFQVTSPDFSVGVEQPVPAVLRVRFNNPVVPGVDRVLLQNLVDAHGNPFPVTLQPISAGTTVANAFNGAPTMITVANAGGDFVQADFVQALDPDDAVEPDSWRLESPAGGPALNLSGCTLSFDLASKRLRIDGLPVDNFNGTSFSLSAAAGAEPHDVDGELFTQGFVGAVSGETGLPTVANVTQNRNQDPTGHTLDVLMSEDVDRTSAEIALNWSVSSANVIGAALQPGLDLVRLTLDAPAIPGDDTLSTADLFDLAGNRILPTGALPMTSTDVTAPQMTQALANAIEGANDDFVAVAFDDDMIAAEVQFNGSWSIESPLGTPLDTSNATVSYDAASRTAKLVFDGGDGINLKRDDDFEISLLSMRDLGGNTVTSKRITGAIQAEANLPAFESAWVETAFTNQVHVRFSEPCDLLDDLAGLTLYTVRDAGGTARGYPSSAVVDGDGMGVVLVFGFSVAAASDTLDVNGVTDLAGNYLFPVERADLEAEDPAAPDLLTSTSSGATVSGEDNDSLEVIFDRRLATWGLEDPANWSLEQAGTPVDLSKASFSYDGNVTVTIDLASPGAPSLRTGLVYDLSVSNLSSAQGVPMAVSAADTLTATGDMLAPNLPAGRARLDAGSPLDTLLIEMDEALDPADMVDTDLIDINGATNPDSCTPAGRRTVRAVFSAGVTTSDTVHVTLRDLAGIAGVASRVVAGQDVSAPLVVSVSGEAVADAGGDLVHVRFNRPVNLATALSTGNYGVTNGPRVLALAGAAVRYESATNTVSIRLAAGQELDPNAGITVDVANVSDHAGLVMNPPASVGGAVTGDFTAPAFEAAFANYREDFSGVVVDVLFDEDVDASFAGDGLNWSVSGGQTVLQVDALSGKMFRLTLDGTLNPGETLGLVGLPDLAGNATGAIDITPVL